MKGSAKNAIIKPFRNFGTILSSNLKLGAEVLRGSQRLSILSLPKRILSHQYILKCSSFSRKLMPCYCHDTMPFFCLFPVMGRCILCCIKEVRFTRSRTIIAADALQTELIFKTQKHQGGIQNAAQFYFLKISISALVLIKEHKAVHRYHDR